MGPEKLQKSLTKIKPTEKQKKYAKGRAMGMTISKAKEYAGYSKTNKSVDRSLGVVSEMEKHFALQGITKETLTIKFTEGLEANHMARIGRDLYESQPDYKTRLLYLKEIAHIVGLLEKSGNKSLHIGDTKYEITVKDLKPEK